LRADTSRSASRVGCVPERVVAQARRLASREAGPAGYMHGAATDLKLKLLREWADHVEKLILPAKGVKDIR
jgi:hypothetical protein